MSAILDAPQQSDEWRIARAGMPTASMFSAVLAKGQGKTRAAYMRRLLAEMLTGKPQETYQNADMLRGIEQEPFARAAYEAETGQLVEQVGFIQHSNLRTGCSPDGLIGADGVIEIKSVIPTVQIETIMQGGLPSEHRAQTQGELWITGRAWLDFASYSPEMPEHLQLYIFRVLPDPTYIRQLEAEVRVFIVELDALYTKFMERA